LIAVTRILQLHDSVNAFRKRFKNAAGSRISPLSWMNSPCVTWIRTGRLGRLCHGEVLFRTSYFGTAVVKENKRGLTHGQYADMVKMLKDLSQAERKTLADPNFINEDEADLIWAARAMKEPGSFSLDAVLRENGIPRRNRA
jgi:hypothetical protein